MSSNTAEYFATVTAIADDLIDRCRQGDIRDLPDAIHEAVDGNHYVIYTHANFEVRAASDSWGACEDEIGWDELVSSASSFDQLASVYAYHAMVHLLNTSIIPSGPGVLVAHITPITPDAARDIMRGNIWQSHIGHEATAQIASALLDEDIAMDRTPMALPHPGGSATCLVLQLQGGAPLEGKIFTAEEMEAVGYDWRLLTITRTA